MYIFTWERNNGPHYHEVVVPCESVVEMAKIFEKAGYQFRVSGGNCELDQSEFGLNFLKNWLPPGVKFVDEA